MRKAEKFKAGETVRTDIGPKLNILVQRSNREIKGGDNIEVKEIGGNLYISAKPQPGGKKGGSSTSEYNGQFKVVKYTEGETTLYKVINGAAPDSAYCGYVGLPGTPQINIPVLVKTGMTTPICYLRTKKDGDSYVSAVYQDDETSPAENEDWVQLGVWNSTLDDVEQVWTSNNHFINYRWI